MNGQAGREQPKQARFAERVFEIVARIPRGRVTTYGRIAAALGAPRSARMVGWAVHEGRDGLPFHRIVNRDGVLTGGWSFGHPDRMKALLAAEGVSFVDEYRVDLAACLWAPDGEDGLIFSTSPDEMDDLDAVFGLEDPA
jgi:methylated-DNA-protein-cysteine methyltransferase-like protein